MMFNIVLYEPEIAPNTGNVIRLCANTGSQLHLIEPLGFQPDDKKLRRAGLDYNDWNSVQIHSDFDAFLSTIDASRLFSFSTKNDVLYTDASYQKGDFLLFGPETRGLPDSARTTAPPANQLTLPMMPNNRSLNLSNSVSIATYDAWRQLGFVKIY